LTLLSQLSVSLLKLILELIELEELLQQ
jgi:hypothetical protein